MQDILKSLYTGSFTAQPAPNTQYFQQANQVEDLWEKVRELIGEDLLEELRAAENSIQFEHNFNWYREGFRLGALLMLELVRS